MRSVIKYLKNYKVESILGPLFKLLEASFELFVPLVVARMIDVGIRNRDVGYILRMGALLALLGVVGLICSLTAQYFAAKSSVGVSTLLRNELYDHINSLSYTELDTVGTSTLITRMTSDINQVQSGVNLFLRLFMRSPFIVFGSMIMAFTVNAKAAMVFVAVIPVLSAVVFGIMVMSMPLYRKVQRRLDKVLLTVRENLAGARVIRAFNRQEDEIRRFDESNSQLVKLQVFVGKISALMNPMTYVIINVAILFLVWTSGRQVDDGVITQGETVALVNYMSQILVELVKLANLIVSISKALACANRIEAVFRIDPGMVFKSVSPVRPDPLAPKVEFRDVHFLYAKSKSDALSDISFTALKGQTVGVIGGTGSGKSTLVNLIPRFYDVSGGAVLIDGIDVREYPMENLREKIGVVPQKAALFRGSVRDNMRWGKEDATDEEIWRALDLAQARDFVESKGDGLDLHIAQGGKNLSGGQRQRLTIARAIVKSPEILIMDDSASALDFATDARLRKAVREGTKNMTVFIVSQRASSIRNADVILVLDDGVLSGKGTHVELMENCQVYREICLSQLSREEAR